MRWKVIGWLLLGPSLLALAQIGRDEEEIRRHRTESNQAIVRGDLSAFASSLDEDFVMVRGSGIFSTREAYLASFAEDFKNPEAVRYERMVDQVDISSAAPLAAEHGHWVGRSPDGRPAYHGTYLAMWRHTGGEWKLRSELFVVLGCDDAALCSVYQASARAAKK